MHTSDVIKVAIERPYDEVYAYLANPQNFPRWAANPDSEIESVGGNDYLVELPMGKRVIRFTQRNAFGVLDYEIFNEGVAVGPVVPVRLHRNGTGCELVLVRLQRPGISPERFRSDGEWLRSDLTRLKTLLEGG